MWTEIQLLALVLIAAAPEGRSLGSAQQITLAKKSCNWNLAVITKEEEEK